MAEIKGYRSSYEQVIEVRGGVKLFSLTAVSPDWWAIVKLGSRADLSVF